MSYRGRASYNRAPNCASRNTKPYIVTDGEGKPRGRLCSYLMCHMGRQTVWEGGFAPDVIDEENGNVA